VAGDVGANMSGQEAQLFYKLTKPDVKMIDAETKSYYQTSEISHKKELFFYVDLQKFLLHTCLFGRYAMMSIPLLFFILVKSYVIFLAA
jgi:hypothetical protein